MSETPQAFQVVYPQQGHKTYELSTFIMGQVLSNPNQSQLRIQGKPASLSPHGFFSETVSLMPGNNYIALELTTASNQFSESRHIVSHYPKAVPDNSPLNVDVSTLSHTGEIALMPGESFTLAFSASPNANITLTIPNILSSPIQALVKYPNAKTLKDGYIDNREPIFKEPHQTKPRIPKVGWFEAVIPVPSNASTTEQQPVILQLEHNGESKQITLPVTFSIWDKPKRAYVQTNNADGVVIRKSPPEGDRLTPLKSGAMLWVNGRIGDWLRIQLSPQDDAWVHQQDIHLESNPNASTSLEPPYVLMHDVFLDTTSLTITKTKPLPLHIEATEKSVTTRIYGATIALNIKPEENNEFNAIHVSQERESVVKIETILNNTCAGFDFFYLNNGATQLDFKILPSKLSDLKIVLDPGHGGNELGSTGLSNLPEKNLNLTIAKLLQKELIASGTPNVQLTRNSDLELPLPARGAFVREHQPHLVISLHHNALPDGRNPKKYKGACCFYYHDFSRPLAEALQNSLVQQSGMSDYGVLHESFYITRIPQAISVLVELGFFTHPDDYERLIDPSHQQKTVQALTQGIHAFFKTQQV